MHVGLVALYSRHKSHEPSLTVPLCACVPVQLSNVMGCLTTYGIGSAPPYFGAGYVTQAKWYQLGFVLSVFYIAVWLGIGGAWWKVIGLW